MVAASQLEIGGQLLSCLGKELGEGTYKSIITVIAPAIDALDAVVGDSGSKLGGGNEIDWYCSCCGEEERY